MYIAQCSLKINTSQGITRATELMYSTLEMHEKNCIGVEKPERQKSAHRGNTEKPLLLVV